MTYKAFDKPHWTDIEIRNLETIIDFVEGIKAKKFDDVINRYSGSEYIQHNRSVESGVKAIVETNRELAKKFPEFMLEAKHVYLDDCFVTFHSHVTFKKEHRGNDNKGLNVVDIWKVENGNITEHWDSIQPLDFLTRLFFLISGGTIKNTNGVF